MVFGIVLVIILIIISAYLLISTTYEPEDSESIKKEHNKREESIKDLEILLDDRIRRVNNYVEDLNVFRDSLANRSKIIDQTMNELANGIYYDKQNDTIVLYKNLERIGDFE